MPDSPTVKTTDKTDAQISYSIIEYTAHFVDPVLAAFRDTASLIGTALKTLKPFGFKLYGVEIENRSKKASELLISFRRAKTPQFTFHVAPDRMWVVAENLDWSEAEATLACVEAGFAAVMEASKYEVESQQIVLGMHVQLSEKTIESVTSPLLSSRAKSLLDGDTKFNGIILIREKATVVFDASAAFPNAMFVKITRQHPATKSLKEIANTLLEDEKKLFSVLEITTDL
jgi:hypothetical protein